MTQPYFAQEPVPQQRGQLLFRPDSLADQNPAQLAPPRAEGTALAFTAGTAEPTVLTNL